jgi:hypothetical protein
MVEFDPKARLVGRARNQGAYRLGGSDRIKIAFNVEALKRLGISFSAVADGSLTGKGANPVLGIILASVDLRKCESAQAAVKIINAGRADAMTKAWHSFNFQLPLPKEFFLTEVAPPARDKYLLDVKQSVLEFEENPAKTRRR